MYISQNGSDYRFNKAKWALLERIIRFFIAESLLLRPLLSSAKWFTISILLWCDCVRVYRRELFLILALWTFIPIYVQNP